MQKEVRKLEKEKIGARFRKLVPELFPNSTQEFSAIRSTVVLPISGGAQYF